MVGPANLASLVEGTDPARFCGKVSLVGPASPGVAIG
jgi:hypothetical protein